MNVVVSLLSLQPWLCPAKPCRRVLQNLMPSGNRQGVGPSGAAGPGAPRSRHTSGPSSSRHFRQNLQGHPCPSRPGSTPACIHFPADWFSDKTAFRFLTHAKLLFSSGLCARCAHRPASPPWTLSSRQRNPSCHPCSPFRAPHTPGFVGRPLHLPTSLGPAGPPREGCVGCVCQALVI